MAHQGLIQKLASSIIDHGPIQHHTTQRPSRLQNHPNKLQANGGYRSTHHCQHCDGTAAIPLPPFAAAGTTNPGHLQATATHSFHPYQHRSLPLPIGRYCSSDTSVTFTINICCPHSTDGATEAIIGIIRPGGSCSTNARVVYIYASTDGISQAPWPDYVIEINGLDVVVVSVFVIVAIKIARAELRLRSIQAKNAALRL